MSLGLVISTYVLFLQELVLKADRMNETDREEFISRIRQQKQVKKLLHAKSPIFCFIGLLPQIRKKFYRKISSQELLDKRAQRKQHKADMAKRRTLASQQRMKIITELASK